MFFITLLKSVYKSLYVHKLRTALTVLGLIIGVVAIIMVLNLGQMLQSFILKQIEVFGTDYIEVEVKVPSTSKTSSSNATGLAQGVSVTTLKLSDAKAIARHFNVRGYYANQFGQGIVSYANQDKTALLWGTTAGFFEFYGAKVVEGRAFTEDEDKNQSKVAVIGQALRQYLFNNQEAVGKYIKISHKKFRVIGVMEEQGSYFGFMDLDNLVYLPIRTLQKQILGIDHISFLMAYLRDPSQAETTAAELTEIMRQRHQITDPKKDDFAVTTMQEAMGMMDIITGALTLLLAVLAGISLLVGGVGIMNIMYVSVAERTYEIGLRKAVGANKKNILQQFLLEALLVTLSGGVIGLVVGFLNSYLIYLLLLHQGFNISFKVAWQGVIAAVAVIMITGLVFGFAPAKKAAELEAAEAMRK